ncbi:MAG: hypothetical protein K6G10_01470 [Butyrivibrio sp.]|nr:hypothetical protein [Butyrivibrio sp.]
MKIVFTDFECQTDCSNITDSMLLSSGTKIASIKANGQECTIEVRGDVRVNFKREDDGYLDVYKDVSKMPKELVEMIRDGSYLDSDRVYIGDNNWFEIFYKDYTELIDCEGEGPEQLKDDMMGFVQAIEDYEEKLLSQMAM